MKKFLLLCCVAFGLLGRVETRADELATQGRQVFEKMKASAVNLQVTIRNKVSVGTTGQSNETRQEVTGTVIDPAGIVVTCLSAADPGQLLQNLGADENQKVKLETEIADVKVLLGDGTEVPAEVAGRDTELDVLFVRLRTKPATALTALNLENPGKAEALDPVISLNRLGSAAQRAYAASLERISAVVNQPRTFYIPMSGVTTTSLGSPAFTLEGKPLGLFVVRAVKDRNATRSMLSSQPSNMTGVIVPAEDILKALKKVSGPAK